MATEASLNKTRGNNAAVAHDHYVDIGRVRANLGPGHAYRILLFHHVEFGSRLCGPNIPDAPACQNQTEM
eukprot:6638132-Lingulodinium_polyedra.AAC.1